MRNEMDWSKTELKALLFCGIIAQVIDFGIDQVEEKVCYNFLEQHWQPQWGDPTEFYQARFQEVQAFIAPRAELTTKLTRYAKKLRSQLTPAKQARLLELMEAVVRSNQVETPQEKQLLTLFRAQFADKG